MHQQLAPCGDTHHSLSATCSSQLLRRLSEDLLDKAPAAVLGAGCDSSDCLLCQGQRQFGSHAISSSACAWLGQRRPPCHTDGQQHAAKAPPASPAAGDGALPHRPLPDPRWACSEPLVSSSSPAAATQQQLQLQQQQQPPWPGRSVWHWRPEFAACEQPAPAQLAPVALLQSPADAAAGHSGGRCDRICTLEFSLDGQLLATAGVSKEVALYSLAALQEQRDWSDVAAAGCRGSGHDAQRLPQPPVLCLPPIATVRLPAKISSSAWSPDMPGLISVGDHDGTLSQVHVASGHFLSEVDAHPGRHILSVAHSRLRRHLAATTSDDCTARLWAGSGLATCVATLSLPGRPAVCSADFSASHDSLLALAAADARVYLYDVRALAQPLAVLHGHTRPVAYARFFGPQQLVSASIDGSLALWDLPALALGQGGGACAVPGGACAVPGGACEPAAAPAASLGSAGSASSSRAAGCRAPPAVTAPQVPAHAWQACSASNSSSCCSCTGAPPPALLAGAPRKLFSGHVNDKHFVGLSVQPSAGLMAVGSETSEVFAYHASWSSPLARFDLQHQQQQGAVLQQLAQPVAATWPQQQQQASVSAVAWQPTAPGGCGGTAALLAAATSAGECRLLTLLQPAG